MLAAGWREIYYVSFGVHEKSRNGKAKCRNVPHAGLRRAHHGHALADAKAWSGAFPTCAGKESGGAYSRERSNRSGPGDGVIRNAADSAGFGRNDVRGIFAARASG